MRPLATIVALLLMCGAALAQNIVAPAEVDEHKLVNAVLNLTLPDGVYLADGGWEVVGETTAQVPDVKQVGAELIFTGTPGVYSILYDGVMLQDVTFTDGAGQTITVNNYKGRVKSRAVCTIKGESDPNPPKPPQPIGQKWQLLIVHQAGEKLASLPQSQRDLLTSLEVRKEVALMGHVLLGIRDDNVLSGGAVKPDYVQPFVDQIKKSGVALPAIAMAPNAGGDVVVKPLPTNWADLSKLLEGK